MGTTADKLNKVLQTKEAIRTAINNKGGTLTETDKFSDYATAINNIQSGSGDNPLQSLLDRTKSARYLFAGYVNNDPTPYYYMNDSELEKFISSINLISCTNMAGMFSFCKNLTTIPQLYTSKVTTLGSMFQSCEKLTTIPQLDTSSCKNMAYMFYGCYKLKTIDITHMNTTSTNGTSSFASSCYSLTKLIIRNMDVIPTLSQDAFSNCYHFYGTTNSTYNPEGLKDGRIYVPGNKIEELKVATNWSVFADIIIAVDFADGEHISKLYINNNKLKLNTPRKAIIYLNEFTNTPTVDITVSNESIAQINNINITTEKITFDINALGTEGNATITVNISGDYNKTLTTEVYYTTPMQYTVEQISEATYGFTLNSNEYYESTNKGKSNSYSLCKLVFVATEKNNTLKLECINSGEDPFDFGILSNIDTTLTLSNNIDTTNVYKSFKGQSSTTPVVITYPVATVGEHFIYIKYRKDSSGDRDNDSLQFRVIS